MALKDNAAAAAKKGKTMSDAEVADFTRLFTEIYKAIDSKQLRPMVRTQYMRTAFQVGGGAHGQDAVHAYRLPGGG